MKLFEYQGREILKKFNIKIPIGFLCSSKKEILKAAKKIFRKKKENKFVIKAQIHAGGRGKAGGIKIVNSVEELKKNFFKILGMRLITSQTSKKGEIVKKILITENIYPYNEKINEYYISILMNREMEKNMILYSKKGGTEIEYIAKKYPKEIFTEIIDPLIGLQDFQIRRIILNLGLKNIISIKEFISFIYSLYNAYIKSDSLLIEINPLLKKNNNFFAVDTKIILDNNSFFRHPNYSFYKENETQNNSEFKANKLGLNFVKLDGNVACMVNGAGLAMATMDIIKLYGGNPANFLDIGGSANIKRIEKALEIILYDPLTRIILINIFGGIVRCDKISQGIINVYNNFKKKFKKIPLIIRLQGNNFEIGKKLLINSKIKNIYLVESLEEAIKKIIFFLKKNI